MKLPLITIILFIATAGFAQEPKMNIYFLKNNGTHVTVRDSADYMRIVSEPDSGSALYNVAEYYLNKNKKLIGKSSTIDPPHFEGQCVTFYKNGVRQSLTNYKNGFPVDDRYMFYPNGKIWVVRQYPGNGSYDINNNYLIRESYDSLGTARVEDGNGYYKGYDETFRYITEEGSVKNGQRDDFWKGGDTVLKETFTENYEYGELINGAATYDDGTRVTYTKREIVPQFNGGLDAFGNYLGKNIRYPADAREKNIQGRVIISFVVEKDGSIGDAKVAKSVYPSVDAEAVRVIKNSPKWIPGFRFGRPVRVLYSVPISFNLGRGY